jgi:hypothetical protein
MGNETTRKEYFIYKGVTYGIGTKILLSDIGCQKHYVSQKHKDKPFAFAFGYSGKYIFGWTDERGWKYGRSDATIIDLEEDIKEIVEPIYVELVPWQQQALNNMINKTVSPDVFGGIFLYIVAMIVGAIFVDRLLIWVFATVVFVVWLLNQYRT